MKLSAILKLIESALDEGRDDFDLSTRAENMLALLEEAGMKPPEIRSDIHLRSECDHVTLNEWESESALVGEETMSIEEWRSLGKKRASKKLVHSPPSMVGRRLALVGSANSSEPPMLLHRIQEEPNHLKESFSQKCHRIISERREGDIASARIREIDAAKSHIQASTEILEWKYSHLYGVKFAVAFLRRLSLKLK